MPRKVKDRALDSREARSKLKVRGMPYFRALDRELHLGYRRIKAKPGTWWARHYLGDQQYSLEALGVADDLSAPDGAEILDFWQAQDRARQKMQDRVKAAPGTDGQPLTVCVALDRYEKDLIVRDRSVENVRRVRAHLTDDLAKIVVALLTSKRLRTFRDDLLEDMEPASVNRVCTPLRAALNVAADLSEGALSREPWDVGLRAIPVGDNSDNVLISEQQTRGVVAGALENSPEFGIFVEAIAVTGARPSQLARVVVGGLKEDLLEIPSSRKGRSTKGKKPHEPVPIPRSLAARLRKTTQDKQLKAPLFAKPSGEPWSKSDHSRPFARAAKRAGLDPEVVTIYALRHSSIVRQILANVPIRLVAVLHDTSVAMIEKHYSTAIAQVSAAVVRPVVLDLGDYPGKTTESMVP